MQVNYFKLGPKKTKDQAANLVFLRITLIPPGKKITNVVSVLHSILFPAINFGVSLSNN